MKIQAFFEEKSPKIARAENAGGIGRFSRAIAVTR
jgi:hypothetical protein